MKKAKLRELLKEREAKPVEKVEEVKTAKKTAKDSKKVAKGDK